MAVVRDIAIIILAVESIIIGVLMMILVWQVYRLVKLLREEIKPLLESTQDTANTVRGTTEFVSTRVVSPVIRLSSALAGLRQGARVLMSAYTIPFRSSRGKQAEPPEDNTSAPSSPENRSYEGGQNNG